MKHASIFRTALQRLTILYVFLAVLVTLSFTIPPIVASKQARVRVNQGVPVTQLFVRGPNGWMILPVDTESTFETRFENFVQQRDSLFGQHLTIILLEINGVLLLVALVASYFLARRALTPLKEVLEQQETFAAELAHELKTPLATAVMELEAFRRSGKGLSADQKEQIEEIAKEVKGVGTVTEQTLALMAVEHAEEAQPQACEMVAIIKQAVATVQPLAKHKQQALEVTTEDGTVKGYPHQLRQLIIILLDNAIKFTPEKGRITLSAAKKGEKYCITVRDNGRGIPSEQLDKIFTKFYQADNEVAGAGLGLAIARRIATAHRGTISATNNTDQGTTFTVTLLVSS